MKSLIALGGFAAFCGFSYATRGVTEIPHIHSLTEPPPGTNDHSLKLMTLNIAHGRGASYNHQLLMRPSSLKNNLNLIAELVRQENPDFCALQEADARTLYSDKLHHSHYIAAQAKMSQFIQGRHVNGLNFSYGTALLSQRPITNPYSYAFNFSPPNPTKGIVIARTIFKNQEIDILSLHLDFMRKKQRFAQINTIVDIVNNRKNPTIIMGDFNSEWQDNGVIAKLCNELSLKTWNPSDKTPTFHKLKKRLDWILIPEEFHFLNNKTLQVKLSDHQPVVAEITF